MKCWDVLQVISLMHCFLESNHFPLLQLSQLPPPLHARHSTMQGLHAPPSKYVLSGHSIHPNYSVKTKGAGQKIHSFDVSFKKVLLRQWWVDSLVSTRLRIFTDFFIYSLTWISSVTITHPLLFYWNPSLQVHVPFLNVAFSAHVLFDRGTQSLSIFSKPWIHLQSIVLLSLKLLSAHFGSQIPLTLSNFGLH